MPIYDYECSECGHIFEEYAAVDDTDLDCPDCKGNKTASRIMGSPAFHLKGNCWAKDGYMSKDINPEKPNK